MFSLPFFIMSVICLSTGGIFAITFAGRTGLGGVVGVGVGVETVSRSRQWRFLLCTLSYGYRLFLVDHLVGVSYCALGSCRWAMNTFLSQFILVAVENMVISMT